MSWSHLSRRPDEAAGAGHAAIAGSEIARSGRPAQEQQNATRAQCAFAGDVDMPQAVSESYEKWAQCRDHIAPLFVPSLAMTWLQRRPVNIMCNSSLLMRSALTLETHVKANIFNICPKTNPLNESCPFLQGDRVVAWKNFHSHAVPCVCGCHFIMFVSRGGVPVYMGNNIKMGLAFNF